MADKKYYWLKLDRNFFKRHDIRIVEDMPNGKEYVLFYMKLLLESIDHEGSLRFNELIPYNDQMLSTITNTNIDIVRSAIKMFQSLKLLEIWDDKTIYINDTSKMLGESTSTHRVKRFRENQKVLQLEDRNVTETLHETELEKEIELDIELDKDKDKYSVYGELKNVKLTKEEYAKLEEKQLLHKIDDLSYYLDSTGKKYKSHYATILKWGRDESKKGETSAKNQSTNKSGYDLTGIINL